jgi:oligopeptide transport system substrate-binding protein
LIASSVRQLGETPAYTFVPPGLKGYEPSVTELRLDVAEARRLLAEAGYPGGKGFPRVGILINTSEDHKRLAEAMADQVRRNLGIELSVYNQEWQSYLDTTRAMDYEMARAGWIGDYLSSPLYDRLIWLAAHVDAFIADPEPMLAKLREPEPIRRQLALERAAEPSEKLAAHERIRFLLFREAEAILVADEFPIMPMYFYVNAGLLRKHVRGFTIQQKLPGGGVVENLKDRHPLSEMWVEAREEGPP